MKTVALRHKSQEIQAYSNSTMLFNLQFPKVLTCAYFLTNIQQPFSKITYFGKTEEERRKNTTKIQEYATFQTKNLFKSVVVVVIRQKN